MKPEIKSETVMAETQFLTFKKIHYKNKNGQDATWDSVSRKNTKNIVMIVPFHEDFERIVIIKEFRVPINDYEYGFPAGLVESNESIEEAARRELKEETGLNLEEIYKITPPLYSSSGLTDESVQVVYARCSGHPSIDSLEDSEDIIPRIYTKNEVRNMLNSNVVNFGAKAYLILSAWVGNVITSLNSFSL